MKEKGIVYVATGKKYVEEAIESARSVQTSMPGIPICLFTDVSGIDDACFTEVRRIVDVTHTFRDKISPLMESPYKKTLFLDTDTYMCASCECIFDLLDRFEMAAARSPRRSKYAASRPAAFSEFNTGVLAFRQTRTVKMVINDWLAIYEEQLTSDNKSNKKGLNDQPAFSEAVFNSNAQVYVLSPEFNLRAYMVGYVSGKVRILHCRYPDMKRVAKVINKRTGDRLVMPSLKRLSVSNLVVLTSLGRAVTGLYTYPKVVVKSLVKRMYLRA